ncbi:unnamed protein product, partial [Tilletia laevis]
MNGWDGIVGVPTGAGKTLPVEMIALASPGKTIVVVCPLVSLEDDH